MVLKVALLALWIGTFLLYVDGRARQRERRAGGEGRGGKRRGSRTKRREVVIPHLPIART